MSSLSFSAVLLAAGRSSRMGRDKALLNWEGRELWRRQWELLEQAEASEIFLSVRPEQPWVPPHARLVVDAMADAGPLAGIAAAMARATNTHLVVLAVDLPQMEAAWFAELRGLCAPGIGAAGRRDGFFEPLAAIYPCALRGATEVALAAGERSLQRFIQTAGAAMRVREITAGEVAWFENWNEPSV